MTDSGRRLSERLHGIADHSMAVTIGNMAQEMITKQKKRESPGYPGHISFTLADAEREAIEGMAAYFDTRGNITLQAWGSLLRVLLMRLGDE